MKHALPIVSAAALIASAGLLVAGPLTPPAGPVASSYKTLAEVEPRIAVNASNTPGDVDSVYRITAPGTYYLTAGLMGVTGKHGIEIAVPNVTLDLSGFAVLGSVGSLDGVTVTGASRNNITVINGVAQGWGGDGVDLGTGSSGRVEDVCASSNSGVGIRVGDGAVIRDCRVLQNTASGIDAGSEAVIEGCTARDNGGDGVYAAMSASVSGCTAMLNTGDGISVGNASVVRGCAASNNDGGGINATANGATIGDCSVYQNVGHGITVGSGCTVHACSAYTNDGDGIHGAAACSITECSAKENSGRGISVVSGCLVRGNVCSNSGLGGAAANIWAQNYGNRIEGNSCNFGTYGVQVSGADNVIIRNSCSGNTLNWYIVTGNAVGPIVSVSGNGSIISGDAYGGSLGSSDPNANFTY